MVPLPTMPGPMEARLVVALTSKSRKPLAPPWRPAEFAAIVAG